MYADGTELRHLQFTPLRFQMQVISYPLHKGLITMANTGLFGPHSLDADTIDAEVGDGIGVYVLGSSNNGTFYVSYVGRSDTDLNARLHQHIGEDDQFKHGFLPTVKACFEKECHLYHDFPNQNNKAHPSKPEETDYNCPVCGA